MYGKNKIQNSDAREKCSLSSSKCRVNYITTTTLSLICFVSSLRSRREGDEISFCFFLDFSFTRSLLSDKVPSSSIVVQRCNHVEVTWSGLWFHILLQYLHFHTASLCTCRTHQHPNSLNPPLPTFSHCSNFNFFFNSTASIANGFRQLGN